jgi:hypothetical protein
LACRIPPNPDPDPLTQLNPNPIRIQIRNTGTNNTCYLRAPVKRLEFELNIGSGILVGVGPCTKKSNYDYETSLQISGGKLNYLSTKGDNY